MRTYRNEGCVCRDGGDAEDYDEARLGVALARSPPRDTLEELAAAFARPMMRALAVAGRDLDVMRIVARCSIDPPEAWDRFDATFDRIRADVLKVMKANVLDARAVKAG